MRAVMLLLTGILIGSAMPSDGDAGFAPGSSGGPDSLVLSSETVRSHIKSILRKLRVSSRREAIAVAQELRGGILAGPVAAA